MKNLLRDLRWIFPSGLGLGLVLSILGPGIWWIGWLTYAVLWISGLTVLTALWRSAGASRILGLMLVLTVVLRLGLGMAFSYILPVAGNDTDVQHAGYIFPDAYRRDTQAWQLAESGDSLWQAFDKASTNDQYGGLLFISSLLDRALSPDAQRPWLMILLASLTACVGVALAYKAAQKAWGDPSAAIVGWIMALYPEAILLGSSQMREPFLIAFIAMGFWGVVGWTDNRRGSIAWLVGSVAGLLLFNSGVAVAAILVVAIWLWLSRKERHVKWWVWVGVAGLVLGAGVLFALAVRGNTPVQGGLLTGLRDWFRFSSKYSASQLEHNSGWLQNVFSSLPGVLHTPFMIAYGIAQPVLPAAIADPAVWPMRVLGILRGLGWYALLPFLVYSLWSVLKVSDKRERFAWLWLWVASWVWILLSSARAGGDQWDNPRYRAILLLFQAALVAQPLIWQRASRDTWLGRLLAVEGVFLLVFGYWYAARYTNWRAGQVHIFVIIAIIAVISIFILVGGWLLDWRKKH